MATRPTSAREIAAALSDAPEDEALVLMERYAEDPRKQVQHAIAAARKRIERAVAERDRVHGMYSLMREMGGEGIVVGVDEVGRGSIAGPLTVGAVALPDEPEILGLNDSKQLTPERREALAAQIADVALAIGCVLIDGNPMHVHPKEKTLVKGDARIACIAAASIVAKVTRDSMMVAYDEEYPGYHLAQCKGYASAEHIAAIKEKGLSPIHRVSFCGNFLETPPLF